MISSENKKGKAVPKKKKKDSSIYDSPSTKMPKTMLEEMILEIKSEGLPPSLLKLLIASILLL